MIECKEVELSEEAIDYVRTSLSNGGRLSWELARIKQFAAGRVRTWLPNDLELGRIEHFASGILPGSPRETQHRYEAQNGSVWRLVPTPDTDECLVSVIRLFLREDKRRICVFENAVAVVSDLKVRPPSLPTFVFGDEVYQFVSGGAGDADLIRKTIKVAQSWLLNGALTTLPPDMDLTSGGTVMQEEQVRFLAAHTAHIVVGAFDGEGFLIWSES